MRLAEGLHKFANRCQKTKQTVQKLKVSQAYSEVLHVIIICNKLNVMMVYAFRWQADFDAAHLTE